MNKQKVEKALEVMASENWQNCSNHVQQLLREAIAPEPPLYVGQPVLVEGARGDMLGNNHLRCITEDADYPFHTFKGTSHKTCKPDPDAASLPNWIEHKGGEFDASKLHITENQIAIFIFDNGTTQRIDGEDDVFLRRVVRYCILPLPQFIKLGE